MTDDQTARLAKFRQLFASLPGRNADKVRDAAELAGVNEGTVRVWCMKKPARIPNKISLMMMEERIKAREAGTA